MKIICTLLILCGVSSAFARNYCDQTVNVRVSGGVDLYEHKDPQELELQRKELELKEKQLALQKKKERTQWELQMKERDELLQLRALGKKDGRCVDHFCEKRCTKVASTDGFCAKHAREIKKGVKEERYKSVSAVRIR